MLPCTYHLLIDFLFFVVFRNCDLTALKHEAEYYGLTPLGINCSCLWHAIYIYSSPSILQPSILRPPLIIRPLDLVPKGNFLW